MRVIAALIAGFLAIAPAMAQGSGPTFPALSGRVVDDANLLSPEQESALTERLRQHEEATTNQVVVATVPSLQGYDIADFGVRLGRHWALGQKDKNNGILLLVAPNDRAVRIDVGYGLEGTMTDALSSVIVNSAILPHFRKNDFPGGISAGVDGILEVLGGNGAKLQQQAAERQPTSSYSMFPLFLLFGFLIVGRRIIASYREHWDDPTEPPGLDPTIRNRQRAFRVLGGMLGSGMGGRGGGGSRGGGFRGGGGSFGGGGSSGRW